MKCARLRCRGIESPSPAKAGRGIIVWGRKQQSSCKSNDRSTDRRHRRPGARRSRSDRLRVPHNTSPRPHRRRACLCLSNRHSPTGSSCVAVVDECFSHKRLLLLIDLGDYGRQQVIGAAPITSPVDEKPIAYRLRRKANRAPALPRRLRCRRMTLRLPGRLKRRRATWTTRSYYDCC